MEMTSSGEGCLGAEVSERPGGSTQQQMEIGMIRGAIQRARVLVVAVCSELCHLMFTRSSVHLMPDSKTSTAEEHTHNILKSRTQTHAAHDELQTPKSEILKSDVGLLSAGKRQQPHFSPLPSVTRRPEPLPVPPAPCARVSSRPPVWGM